MTQTLQEKRERRKKETAEFFTPPVLVNQMLDKLPEDVWEPGKTFCDPAAGDGNFLVAILRRKLQRGHPPLDALRTIWGVELMEDNVIEMKSRLLQELPSEYHRDASAILDNNIVCHDTLTWDFENWRSTREAPASSVVSPLF